MKMKSLCCIALTSLLLAACSAKVQGERAFHAKQYTAAFNHLLPVARQGDADAEYAIGYMYYNGEGVPRDFDLALYWFHRAALQHQALAVQAVQLINKTKADEPFPPPEGMSE